MLNCIIIICVFTICLCSCDIQNPQLEGHDPVQLDPEFREEMLTYSLDPDHGGISWIHPPVDIVVDKNQQVDYKQQYPTVLVRDFLIAADLTWETTSQSSGCGYSLRTHGSFQNPDRYLIFIARGPYGHIQFAAFFEGKLANLRDLYIQDKVPEYSWENGSTNRLAVKAIGQILTVYLNHSEIGFVDTSQQPTKNPSYPPPPVEPHDNSTTDEQQKYQKLEEVYHDTVKQIQEQNRNLDILFKLTRPIFYEGYVGFTAINSTGTTTCRFTDAWLWHIDFPDSTGE